MFYGIIVPRGVYCEYITMKSERGIIEEKEQEYGDSVILIYHGFCYVFTKNNSLMGGGGVE